MAKWKNLTMTEKSELIKLYIDNGITSLDEMKDHYNEQKEDIPYEGYDAGKHGMMKSRMAYAEMFGNKAAKRMVSANSKTGIIPKEYLQNEDGSPATEDGIGTHFMGSYGNEVRTSLYDDGQDNLQFRDRAPRNDSESIRFDRDEDAEYFAEHYKEIAPMMKGVNEFPEGGKTNSESESVGEAFKRYIKDQWDLNWNKKLGEAYGANSNIGRKISNNYDTLDRAKKGLAATTAMTANIPHPAVAGVSGAINTALDMYDLWNEPDVWGGINGAATVFSGSKAVGNMNLQNFVPKITRAFVPSYLKPGVETGTKWVMEALDKGADLIGMGDSAMDVKEGKDALLTNNPSNKKGEGDEPSLIQKEIARQYEQDHGNAKDLASPFNNWFEIYYSKKPTTSQQASNKLGLVDKVTEALKRDVGAVIKPSVYRNVKKAQPESTFDEAYKEARERGDKSFIWGSKTYNTDYSGTHHKNYEADVKSGYAQQWAEQNPGYANPELIAAKREEQATYGITNEFTRNKSIIDERLHNNLDPFGYENPISRVWDAVVMNNVDELKAESGDSEYYKRRNNLFDTLLGYPNKTGHMSISDYLPTQGYNAEKDPSYYMSVSEDKMPLYNIYDAPEPLNPEWDAEDLEPRFREANSMSDMYFRQRRDLNDKIQELKDKGITEGKEYDYLKNKFDLIRGKEYEMDLLLHNISKNIEMPDQPHNLGHYNWNPPETAVDLQYHERFDPSKRRYATYYDKWDINPWASGDAPNLLGTPIPIYDRMYTPFDKAKGYDKVPEYNPKR